MTDVSSEGQYNIGYFVGSLAKDSINRRVVNAIIRLAPENMKFTEITWDDFPVYNRDFDENFPKNFPKPYTRAKELAETQDGFLVVSPEYNRSIPGGLKNAFDAMSRPYGTSPFSNKPIAVTGASMSSLGTGPAQMAWKAVVGFFNMAEMGQPEGYIHYQPGTIDVDGTITDESTKEFLQSYVTGLSDFFAGQIK